SSIGHLTPLGTNTNEPSVNTAEFRAAKKLSLRGTTEPMYFLTMSGCSLMASEIEQKMTPASASFLRNVVATETLSNTASTATSAAPSTPARTSCSFNEIPSLL